VEWIGKRVFQAGGGTIQDKLSGQVNEDLAVEDCTSRP
jgi:hypothetical protein